MNKVKISHWTGYLDLEEVLEIVKPEINYVNEDADKPEKRELCAQKGIEYKVGKRVPFQNLPIRSTTAIRAEIKQALLNEK